MKSIILACLIAVAYSNTIVEDEIMDEETSALTALNGEVQDFTINHSLRRTQEVVAKEGTPGASSPGWDSNWSVDRAFNQPDYSFGYHTKDPYGNAPQMIWYHFREAFRPAEITFRAAQDPKDVPTKFQLVGSNDDHCNQYSPWTILCEDLRGLKVSTRYQIQRCVVNDFHTKSYKCVGLRILSGGLTHNDPNVGLGNMRFWKRVE
eukprot:TCONS_00035066-protein